MSFELRSVHLTTEAQLEAHRLLSSTAGARSGAARASRSGRRPAGPADFWVLEQHIPRPLCACTTVQRHREPRSTSFWIAACPLRPAGHCAARGSRAHHRPDQLADWPRSAVRFIYCRLKPCDDACAHARSFASTWALPTNSRATGVFSPRRIRRSNVARAQTKSRITPIRARNENRSYLR